MDRTRERAEQIISVDSGRCAHLEKKVRWLVLISLSGPVSVLWRQEGSCMACGGRGSGARIIRHPTSNFKLLHPRSPSIFGLLRFFLRQDTSASRLSGSVFLAARHAADAAALFVFAGCSIARAAEASPESGTDRQMIHPYLSCAVTSSDSTERLPASHGHALG
jgi:hypothetical protein